MTLDFEIADSDVTQMLSEWSDADIQAHLESDSVSDRVLAQLLINVGYDYTPDLT